MAAYGQLGFPGEVDIDIGENHLSHTVQPFHK